MQPQETTIQIEGHILEGQTLDRQGHEVRVTVIQGGQSKNGFVYDQPTLQQLARMIEGAQAYADHNTSVAVRSVRDIIGFYKNATYMPPDGTNSQGRVDATLHILEAADWLWSIIYEACSIGKPELIGLSVDIFGKWQLSDDTTGRAAKHITGIQQINSCDIVTRASAGGAFQRILHDDQQPQGDHMDPTTTIPPITTVSPDSNTPPVTPPATPPTTTPTQQQGHISEQAPALQQQSHILEQQQLLEVQRQQINQLFEEAKLQRAQLSLEQRLMQSILPDAVKSQIKARYAGRIFEDAELEADMTSAITMMADLTRAGIISGHGYARPEIGEQITEAEKVQASFDLMFGLEVDTRFAGIKPFGGLREAYIRATGDAQISGASSSDLGRIRVSESAPIGRITEADTTTASFSFLLGTSMNKRLLKDYQAWPAEWQRFCTVVPIKDFKQQTRVRLGAFGSLSTVAEDTAYTTISLTDSAATYVPTKRGNLVTVSRETIINDDMFAIKQIPTKLAVAAAYTLAEFVYAFLSANPNIYDGHALFETAGLHTNLGTSALSSAAMQTGVTAMREQTNFAGKRIGLRPKYLIVPAELEWTAMVVTKSAGVPGSTNNDINPMLGYVTPIISPQLTNATQWFFSADPMIIDTIEIGFVGGQVNPVLLVQDQPLYGLNFTQDVISYKVRHEYGAAVVDFRGLYRGI